MKRYVSLAGALLLGTVVATNPKQSTSKAATNAVISNVIVDKKATNVHPAKKQQRSRSRDQVQRRPSS